MKKEFHRQVTIKLDLTNFQKLKILLNLQLPIEAFDDEPKLNISGYFIEEEL